MRKNKKTFLIAVLIAGLLLSTGAVLAYMYHKANVEVELKPAQVTCKVEESFDGTNKSSIKVENTGNIEAYLRVTLISHWEDKMGTVVGEPSVMPKVTYDATKWLEKGDVYYYKNPVAPSTPTDELLNEPIVLTEKEVDGKQIYRVVEVFAEAIQSKPINAVTESWSVTVDGSGTIQN